MDLQGTPTTGAERGMKNTTDPRAKEPIQEATGVVASDSLAADSYNSGGGFADNDDAAPSGQPGAGSTLNTTDTSAARKLDQAQSHATRNDDDDSATTGSAGTKYPDQSGQPSFSGATNAGGYSGGNSAGYKAQQEQDNQGYQGATGDGHSQGQSGTNFYSKETDVAPNYVADVYLGDNNKPKGNNLKEDDNLRGKRVDDYEVGSQNDPGRAAVQGFSNAASTGQVGGGGAQTEIDGDNTYDTLRDENA